MLIQFAVSNFRSIKERQVLSMVASNYDKSLPEVLVSGALTHAPKTKLLKGAAIYGPNASGKSNLLEALGFLSKIVRTSTRLEPDAPTDVESFTLDAVSRDEASRFEIEFVEASQHYRYELALTLKRVISESLFVSEHPLIRKSKTDPFLCLFSRSFDQEKESYEWEPDAAVQDVALQERTRENTLFLSVAAFFNQQSLRKPFSWLTSGLRFLALDWRSRNTLRYRVSDPLANTERRKRVIDLLCKADVGIEGVEVVEREISVEEQIKNYPPSLREQLLKDAELKPRKEYELFLLHSAAGSQPVPMLMEDESAGTQRFFLLLTPWLDALERGQVLVADEIETSLHPHLVRELVAMFMSVDSNPNGAQIIFSSHDALLLNTELLRRDQIWLTEKGRDGATRLFPLSDFKVRNNEALARGYLAGRYGGVPLIPKAFR